MQDNRDFKVFPVAESAGCLLDCLDCRIQPLVAIVHDPIFQECQDIDKILAKHPGDCHHWFQSRSNRPFITRY